MAQKKKMERKNEINAWNMRHNRRFIVQMNNGGKYVQCAWTIPGFTVVGHYRMPIVMANGHIISIAVNSK